MTNDNDMTNDQPEGAEKPGFSLLPFPGGDFWDGAGLLVSRPDFDCTSLHTERGCYMGGGDPVQEAYNAASDLRPAYLEAAADYWAYMEEHRRPDGLTTGHLRIPAAVDDRFNRLDREYHHAEGALSDTVERTVVAAILEAFALAGVTDTAPVFDICRRVMRGE